MRPGHVNPLAQKHIERVEGLFQRSVEVVETVDRDGAPAGEAAGRDLHAVSESTAVALGR